MIPFSNLSKMTDIYFDQQFHKFMLHLFSVLGNVNFHLLSASASSSRNKEKKKLTFYWSKYVQGTLNILLHALSHLIWQLHKRWTIKMSIYRWRNWGLKWSHVCLAQSLYVYSLWWTAKSSVLMPHDGVHWCSLLSACECVFLLF